MTDQIKKLEDQLGRGWSSLRFDESLEPAFQQQYMLWQIPFRLSLIGVAAVLIGATPLFDAGFLHPPEAFAIPVHRVQLLVMLPALLIAGYFTLNERLRAWSNGAGMIAVGIVAFGLLYQRHLGAMHGYVVPTELVCVTVASAYVMAGLGFWRFTPLAILILGLTGANEVVSYGSGSATQYTIIAEAMQFLIAGTAGYLQEHFARGAWLRRELLALLAAHDSLTGLLNVRAFDQRYQELHSQATRESRPLLVALLDLDYFKQFNDGYGHAAGDQCLRKIAGYMAAQFPREADIKARIGGEEFALVCQDLDYAGAARALEDLRAGIAGLEIPHQHSLLATRVMTASIGAVWFSPRSGLSADAARQLADVQLYNSKHAGRNRVTLASGDEPRR